MKLQRDTDSDQLHDTTRTIRTTRTRCTRWKGDGVCSCRWKRSRNRKWSWFKQLLCVPLQPPY